MNEASRQGTTDAQQLLARWQAGGGRGATKTQSDVIFTHGNTVH